ncbi:MAG: hypothetical protein U5N26_10090 [Candidatus Marinimicrobia bacterium]|nr:hypothetical protein [Candidatus Neomarinimicrobiota bacterium]
MFAQRSCGKDMVNMRMRCQDCAHPAFFTIYAFNEHSGIVTGIDHKCVFFLSIAI